jgi:hypothetical protein
MTTRVANGRVPSTTGKIFHWPLAYDLVLRLIWGGAERGVQ